MYPRQLAPCTEAALAAFSGCVWQLYGSVNRPLILPQYQHNHWKLQYSKHVEHGTWNHMEPSHMELGCHICPFPPPQHTFPCDLCHLPPSLQTGSNEVTPLNHGPRWLSSFSESICGHTLPSRTFPCGSLHLPQHRFLVPFGMPWGAQDICTKMADMTQDYRRPVPICTSGRKPGRTPDIF